MQTLVDEGRLTEEEAEHHPQRSVIMRVLTGDSDDEPDLSMREARVGDRYLLCSDGLSGVVRYDTLPRSSASTTTRAPARRPWSTWPCAAGRRTTSPASSRDVVDAGVDGRRELGPEVVGRPRCAAGAARPEVDARGQGRRAWTGPRRTTTRDDDPTLGRTSRPGRPQRCGLRRRRWSSLGVLVAGGYAAYALEPAAVLRRRAGGNVAIFRGLPQDLGPISLSHVYQKQDLALVRPAGVHGRAGAATRSRCDDLAARARARCDELRTQACHDRPPRRHADAPDPGADHATPTDGTDRARRRRPRPRRRPDARRRAHARPRRHADRPRAPPRPSGRRLRERG